MLSMFVNDRRDNWNELLPFVMHAYRTSVHESTGYSPFHLMMGEECSLPQDVSTDELRTNREHDVAPHPFATWVRDALEVAYMITCTIRYIARPLDVRDYTTLKLSIASFQWDRGCCVTTLCCLYILIPDFDYWLFDIYWLWPFLIVSTLKAYSGLMSLFIGCNATEIWIYTESIGLMILFPQWSIRGYHHTESNGRLYLLDIIIFVWFISWIIDQRTGEWIFLNNTGCVAARRATVNVQCVMHDVT